MIKFLWEEIAAEAKKGARCKEYDSSLLLDLKLIINCAWQKEKQLETITSYIQGNDTFVSLPTGFESPSFLEFFH